MSNESSDMPRNLDELINIIKEHFGNNRRVTYMLSDTAKVAHKIGVSNAIDLILTKAETLTKNSKSHPAASELLCVAMELMVQDLSEVDGL